MHHAHCPPSIASAPRTRRSTRSPEPPTSASLPYPYRPPSAPFAPSLRRAHLPLLPSFRPPSPSPSRHDTSYCHSLSPSGEAKTPLQVLASQNTSSSSPLPPQNDSFMIDSLLASARRSPASAAADVHVNRHGEFYFMYRYIFFESSSQFDSSSEKNPLRSGSIDIHAAQRAAALDEIESLSKLVQRIASPPTDPLRWA